jgi:hypothetical protein
VKVSRERIALASVADEIANQQSPFKKESPIKDR